MANLAKNTNKNFKWHFFMGSASCLTPLKEEEYCFPISFLVCATELTQCTTYGKVHWMTLNLFLKSIISSQFYTRTVKHITCRKIKHNLSNIKPKDLSFSHLHYYVLT